MSIDPNAEELKEQTIVQKHKDNFETLRKAFIRGDIALMECEEVATGEKVAVICAATFDGKEYQFTPFARFFNGNPYEMLRPPKKGGGFYPAEEKTNPLKLENEK